MLTFSRHYNALGAPQDAADSLILEAYQNQMNHTESKLHPFYLEFLKTVASERSSEIIQEECVMELSRGRYDMEALIKAFKSIGLEYKDDSKYDDNYILGMFNSRIEDMRMHERDLRDNLQIIGKYRGSRIIRDTAENGECLSEPLDLY